jgi:dipeptidyl-peptidase-4
MKNNILFVAFFIVSFILYFEGKAQYNGTELKLEDIYSNNKYTQKGFGPVRWMKDNKGYSTIEYNSKTKGYDIVRYNATTNKKTVLISSEKLIPKGEAEPLKISNYIWSDDNAKVLIFTNTQRVWRYHTRGDYWILDMKNGELIQLGKSVKRTTMMFAKFSPDATKVAYVSKQNIYVENIASAEITQITFDGGDNIINGTFDWVYEEELDCRDGFRWSSDGKHIAYWQSDTEGVGTFYMIDNVDSLYSRPIPLPYPKVGTSLSAVKVGVVSSAGGETKWFNIVGDPRNNYIARMDFIPNSNDLLIQQLNRSQNTNKVFIANAETIQLTNIFTEKDDAYLDLHDDIKWLENEKYFTWTSERNGWCHLYKISRDGKLQIPITKGKFDVVSISCIDDKGGYVYYIASPKNFTQRYLYRSKLNGKGEAERVTPKVLSGQNSYQISGDAKWAILNHQNAVTPNQYSLISLPKHNEIRILEDNKDAKERYDNLDLNPKEFIKVDIGDVVLDAWMIKPNNFDKTKKYPIIFYVYGEPAGTTVQDNWQGGDLWHQYLAQQGYILMSIDNRGTKVPRGRDFRKSVYGQIGLLAADDQAKAAKKIFTMFPFIDTDRVGIWGWSGGGQMTLHCMFRHADIYKTGIAVSFVSDQRLYDATYQERYMGLLEDNPKGYFEGSPINHAQKLEGNLLIVHGTADDNVHYQSFEMLVNKLIENNKQFSMMSYPMRSHGIYERKNTSYHLRKLMENYWKTNLKVGVIPIQKNNP